MLKRTDDRASVAERRNVCARRSGAADGLLFSLFVWLGARDRSWADYSPIYCTAGVDPLLPFTTGRFRADWGSHAGLRRLSLRRAARVFRRRVPIMKWISQARL